ncbi:MAG: aminotransferase class V-fold PLP-dependent enzyme, partial [Planctomycetaceae bacterium]|nr:aminotransferase class V-fold PLP-dependent enzyme [Planctomycetaceae bacterium]
TTWPKPAAVYDAVDRYQRECGVAVGRGATRQAGDVRRTVDRCRELSARLLGARSADSVSFCFNGTDALNIGLHGVLRAGDHVVTTVIEHNSVLRPLAELRERIGIEVTRVGVDSQGVLDPREIERAVTPRTALIAVTHASNVTGAVQPIADVAAIAHRHGALCLVDAAQTAGHCPIDVAGSEIDLLACSGHKGLLGPLGTGLFYVRPEIADRVRSFRQGGTGSRSESDRQPKAGPDTFESGNHNAPGLVGLEAALRWIEANGGVRGRQAHEQELVEQLLEGLRQLPAVTVYGPSEAVARTGVVSLNVAGLDPQDAAAILDDSFGIETRAGLHCAPGAHESLGTLAAGGTLRLSVGPFVTAEQIAAAIAAIAELAV